MRLLNWLRPRNAGQTSRPARRTTPPPFRPHLEMLEDRLCPSGGALDTTFGTGGQFSLPGSINGGSQNVAIDTNPADPAYGRIVSVGSAPTKSTGYSELAIVRLTQNGQLDTSFNKTGVVDLNVGYNDGGTVVIQPDGKILVAGGAWPTLQDARSFSDDTEFFLARYNPDGTPDTTFGKRGLVVMNPTPLNDGIGKLAIIPTPNDPGNPFRIVAMAGQDKVYEFDQYGNLMKSFGTNGIATYQLTPHFGINDFAVAPVPTTTDNPLGFDIILTGHEGTTAWHDTGALFAVNATTGLPDPNFNGGQWLSVPDPHGGALGFNAIAIQQDPTTGIYSIIVAGGTWMQNTTSDNNNVLARYSLTGVLDTSFGNPTTPGFSFTPATGSSFNKVAVEPDGSIVVESTSGNLTVGHFTASGQQDTMFGDQGTGYEMISGVSGQALVIDTTGSHDGSIVVSGYSQTNARGAFFARLTSPL